MEETQPIPGSVGKSESEVAQLCLTLSDPMDRGAWKAIVCKRVRHDLATKLQQQSLVSQMNLILAVNFLFQD